MGMFINIKVLFYAREYSDAEIERMEDLGQDPDLECETVLGDGYYRPEDIKAVEESMKDDGRVKSLIHFVDGRTVYAENSPSEIINKLENSLVKIKAN